MPIISLDSMSFSGLVWTFQLLPCTHRNPHVAFCAITKYIFKTSIWGRRTIKVKTLQLKNLFAVPTKKVRPDMLLDMGNQKTLKIQNCDDS
jgi:hypothetical protein